MVAALGQGVLLHDSVGRVTAADETAAGALRVGVHEVIGRTWHDPSWTLVRQDGRPLAGHEHPVMQVLSDGRPRHGTLVGLQEADGLRWLRFDVVMLAGTGPTVVGALVGDVTSQVHAGFALAVESVRSRRLLAPERDVLLRVSRWGRVVGASEACEDVLGRPVDDVVGCSVVELVSPADRPAVKARLDGLPFGEVAVMRVRVRRRGGERRWTRLGMRWTDANLSEAHVVLADEHDAVVAGAALAEVEGRLATVAALARETVGLHAADGTWTWVSDRASDDLGHAPADLVGRPLHDLVHRADSGRVDAAHAAAAAGDTATVRYRVQGADGAHRLVESVLSGHLDPGTGRLVELRSVTRPADDLARDEQHVDLAGQTLRRVLEQSPTGVLVLAPDGSWQTVNDAALRLLGQARGALAHRRHEDLLVGPGRDDVLDGLREVATGRREAWHGPAGYASGDGSTVAVRLTASAVGADGTPGTDPATLVVHVEAERAVAAPGAGHGVPADDGLTGLRPTDLAVDRLVNALERSTRTGRSVGVVWIVLDGLEDLVAQHGPAAGDSVLVEVSTRLRRTIRLGDTLARVGEDAFLLVCEDVHELEISRVAARVCACVDVPAPGTARGRVTASVGSAARPCSGTEHAPAVGEELVAAADTAASDVRRRGGAGWHHSKHTFV